MSEAALVRRETRGRVAWVTLDRPEALNALSKRLVAELGAALAQLRAEIATGAIAAVVLTGAGDKAFCAGADLKERLAMSLPETRAFLSALNRVVDELAALERPVIAALNGAALGGGLELALACDVRICADGVRVGLPEVKLGIIPGAGGTQRLARACGVALAKELVLTGRRIDATRARALGLVSAVVPADSLAAEAALLAEEIADAGPLALAQAKRVIDEGFALPLAEGLALERAAYEVVLASDDRNEGLRAFVEKRKPLFTGK